MPLRPLLPLVLGMAWAARGAHLPGLTVGIDLGTTNSAVAIVRDGVARVVPNERGAYTTPSVVAFTNEGGTLTGEAALEQSVSNARNTVHGAKRFIGRRYDRVLNLKRMASVAVSEEEEGGGALFELPALAEPIRPEEVSAALLGSLLDDAERATGRRAERAVITVRARQRICSSLPPEAHGSQAARSRLAPARTA